MTTDVTTLHEWFDRVRTELDKRADDAEEYQYCWLEGIHIPSEYESQDYCPKHAGIIYDKIWDGLTPEEKEDEDDGVFVCRRWHETSDGPRFCEWEGENGEYCGRILSVTYTDYAAEQDLENCESLIKEGSVPFDWNKPADCYEIANMLGAWIGDGWFKVEEIPNRDRVVAVLSAGANYPTAILD